MSMISNVTMSVMLRDRCGSTSSAESSSFSSQPSSPPDMSSTDDPRRLRQSNSSRYKTELCRAYEEYGTCKYGEKCQFAHGMTELRSLCRHPKYKTEMCRTFHTEGFCPYGKRCHFVHTPKDEMVNIGSDIKLSPLDMHAHSGEPLFLDNFSGTPPNSHHFPGTPPNSHHMAHMPSPPAPTRLDYFEPQLKRKNEFYIVQQDLPHLGYRDLNELARQYLVPQQTQVARKTAPNLGDQWKAAQALRNALEEVVQTRLPVFTGLGTA